MADLDKVIVNCDYHCGSDPLSMRKYYSDHLDISKLTPSMVREATKPYDSSRGLTGCAYRTRLRWIDIIHLVLFDLIRINRGQFEFDEAACNILD